MSSPTHTLRPVTPTDFSQIASILNHYIHHSIITFRTTAIDAAAVSAIYEETKIQELPFFVVVDNDRVLGYLYALRFRHERPACHHTVEISIYVHPDYRGKGVGGQVMKGLFDALKARGQTGVAPEKTEPAEKKITQVLAIMAFDVNGPTLEESRKLRGWYTRWGFEQVGQLKSVGWKFERWIDDLVMQVSLD